MSCENETAITTRWIPGYDDLDAEIPPSQAIDWQTEGRTGTIFVLKTGHLVGVFPNAHIKAQIEKVALEQNLLDVLQRVPVTEPNHK
jgi:hypothetical protein